MEVKQVREHLKTALGKRWKWQICRPDTTLGGPLCKLLIERVAPYCKPSNKTVSGINADGDFILRLDVFREIAAELGRIDSTIYCGDTLWSTILVSGFWEDDKWPPPGRNYSWVDCRDILPSS